MQKTLFVVILCFTLLQAYGQASPTGSIPKLSLQANKIVYYDTVFLDTAYSKSQLFDNAHQWYAHHFETSDDRLTIDNSDMGMISGAGTVNFKKHKTDYKDLLFTVDIIAAKGYYIYSIYNLYGYDEGVKFDYSDIYQEELYPVDKPQWPKEVRMYKLNNMDTSIKEIINNLKVDMQRK